MVKIMAEWVGLGPEATEEQIADAIRDFGAEKRRLLAENSRLRTELGQTGDPAYDRVIRKHRAGVGTFTEDMSAESCRRFLAELDHRARDLAKRETIPLHVAYSKLNRDPDTFERARDARRVVAEKRTTTPAGSVAAAKK